MGEVLSELGVDGVDGGGDVAVKIIYCYIHSNIIRLGATIKE